MSIEGKAAMIAATMLCLFSWPAHATPKRDAAFQKCHDNNFQCESKCVSKTGAAYTACTNACTTAYSKCNDSAEKIPLIQVGKGVKNPQTLTVGTNAQGQGVKGQTGKTDQKKLPH